MDYLPIFLKVENRPCLVVGGGKVAARKVALLHRAGARITVVSPEKCNEVKTLVEQGAVTCVEREFRKEDKDGVVLVIAATNDEAINRTVSELANQQRIPVDGSDEHEDEAATQAAATKKILLSPPFKQASPDPDTATGGTLIYALKQCMRALPPSVQTAPAVESPAREASAANGVLTLANGLS